MTTLYIEDLGYTPPRPTLRNTNEWDDPTYDALIADLDDPCEDWT